MINHSDIQLLNHDVGEYETVVIGFSVWWYTVLTIINTFIESVDLSGKKLKYFGLPLDLGLTSV